MEPHPYSPTAHNKTVSHWPSPTPAHYIQTIPPRKQRPASEAELASWTRGGCVPPAVPDPPYAFTASFNPGPRRYGPRTPAVVAGGGFGVVIVDHLDDTPPPDDLKCSLDPTVPPFRPDHIRRLEITPPPDGGRKAMNPAVAPFRPTLVRHIEATPPLDVIEQPSGEAPVISPVVCFETPPGYGNAGHRHAPARRSSTPGTDPECGGTKVSDSSKFSLHNLSEDDRCRRIRARDVRAQAAAIPAEMLPRPKYPHLFGNIENLGLLHNRQPVIEYPLIKGPRLWREGPRPPGPGRIVVNQHDRSKPEVVYHDPTKEIVVNGQRKQLFSIAEYRPAGYYSKRSRPEGEREREEQEARKRARREDMRAQRRSDNASQSDRSQCSHSQSAHPNHNAHSHTPHHAGPVYAHPEAHLSPRVYRAAPIHHNHPGGHGPGAYRPSVGHTHPEAHTPAAYSPSVHHSHPEAHSPRVYHPSVSHTHPEARAPGGYYTPIPHDPRPQAQVVYANSPQVQVSRTCHPVARAPPHRSPEGLYLSSAARPREGYQGVREYSPAAGYNTAANHHSPATHHLTPATHPLSPDVRYLSPAPHGLDGYQSREYSPSVNSSAGGYQYQLVPGRHGEHNEHAGGYNEQTYEHRPAPPRRAGEYPGGGGRYYG